MRPFRCHINSALGRQELQHVLKHGIEAMLGKMADQGKGEATLRRAFMLVHELFSEAVENNYVMKNSARRIVSRAARESRKSIRSPKLRCERFLRTLKAATG